MRALWLAQALTHPMHKSGLIRVLKSSTERLAVNRYDFPLLQVGNDVSSTSECLSQSRWAEHREYATERVVGRDAVRKLEERFNPRTLEVPEVLNRGEGVGPAQNRAEGQPEKGR